jgi:PLD-like domain
MPIRRVYGDLNPTVGDDWAIIANLLTSIAARSHQRDLWEAHVEDKFVSGNDIVEAIHLSATERAYFAVAYWGKNAAKRLGLDKNKKPVRIICDLWSYACNPSELQKLLELGFELKTKDGFHAKVYITTNRVIIGSANASINGLGDEDKEDFELEAAVVSFDKAIIQAARVWFDNHWKTACEIDKPKLDKYRRLWLRRQRERSANNLLRLVVEDPTSIGETIHLVVFEDGNQDDYKNAWPELKKEYSEAEISNNDYGPATPPYYLDHGARLRFSTGRLYRGLLGETDCAGV